jgi:hypothetical protein
LPEFFRPNPVIPVIRSFQFNAPSKGTAAVSFHGSLVCANQNVPGDRVVDFETQIVGAPGAEPNMKGPGGLRLAARLLFGTSDTFNLASTRVVSIPAAGARTLYFKIAPRQMDTNTYCLVYNAVFTVQFVP